MEVNKKFILDDLNKLIQKKGLSQSDIADKLNVTRSAVSKWFKNKAFPKPKILLELSLLLGENLIKYIQKNEYKPVIHFRKVGNKTTKNEHYETAEYRGYALKELVEYLPFETLTHPKVLHNPINEYNYIQSAVTNYRSEMGVTRVLDFSHIINFFNECHAVLIPVLWGEKEAHENAMYIYLPDSMTSWVYLNLDTNIIDFKFWMSHELGHIVSNNSKKVETEKSEKFADRFASALLFPKQFAQEAYSNIKNIRSTGAVINYILELAQEFVISPYTIYSEIEHYVKANNLSFNNLKIWPATTNFKKNYPILSKSFVNNEYDIKDYICNIEENFKTPIFKMVRSYYKNNPNKSYGFIEKVFGFSNIDSHGFYMELKAN